MNNNINTKYNKKNLQCLKHLSDKIVSNFARNTYDLHSLLQWNPHFKIILGTVDVNTKLRKMMERISQIVETEQ